MGGTGHSIASGVAAGLHDWHEQARPPIHVSGTSVGEPLAGPDGDLPAIEELTSADVTDGTGSPLTEPGPGRTLQTTSGATMARLSPRRGVHRVILSPRRPWRRHGRASALAFAIVLLATACGSPTSPDSPGATINLHPSPSVSVGPTVAPSATPVATPSSTPPASLSVPPSTPAATPIQTTGGPSRIPTATPSQVVVGSPVTATLDWTDCGAPFECATLMVPLDYANPGGEQISLALIRLPAADPSARIGSLLVNPGGPGGSGVEFVQTSAESIYTQKLRDRFDIIGFDPRGVGQSTPVECLNGKDLDRLNALDPTPDVTAERDALIEGAQRVRPGL